MSRLSTLSPAAIRAMYSADSDEILITLVTIKANPAIGLGTNIYLADNFTQRISETPEDILYGVVSNATPYIFLPLQVTLPNDDNTSAPRCIITINDVTKYLIPSIRQLTGPPEVDLVLVLNSSPNLEEASFKGFKLTNVNYNAETITADLTMPSLEVEPFPSHSFTPAYFPGLF